MQMRRSFLKWMGGLLGGGAIGSALYSMLGGIAPIDTWVEVGPLSDLPDDKAVRKAVTVVERRSVFYGLAPFGHPVDGAIWIRRDSNNQVVVFNATCPHKSWLVTSAPEGFFCSNHKSRFDRDGRVLEGPARRALDTLEYKIVDGVVSVRFQNFRKELAVKEVVS
jgi:Rieske Fe-S protein